MVVDKDTVNVPYSPYASASHTVTLDDVAYSDGRVTADVSVNKSMVSISTPDATWILYINGERRDSGQSIGTLGSTSETLTAGASLGDLVEVEYRLPQGSAVVSSRIPEPPTADDLDVECAISDSEILTGDAVNVDIHIKNPSEFQVEAGVEVNLAGETETEVVDVPAGGSATQSFPFYPPEGDHAATVTVDVL